MKIKDIYIKKFGGITNFRLELKAGLNIIEGPNESGKSTTMAFIKSMLFGLGNKKGKDVRNNDRLRYMPLDGARGEGQLVVEHKNEEILINKSFGATKKADSTTIYDNLTGNPIECGKEIGEFLLGIKSDTFENTLFIRQLGSKVSKNKDDEIVMKITNIFENGEDSSNYDKAVKNIEETIKSLQNSRKSGQLDKLKNKLSELTEERYDGLILSEKSIDNEKRLIQLNTRKEFINTEVKKLELYRKHLRRAKLNKEYEDIKEYLVKSESLKKEQKEIYSDLKCRDGVITYDFIELIKSDKDRYLIVEETLEEKKKILKEIDDNEKEAQNNIGDFEKFQDLEAETDLKVTKLLGEIQSLKEKILIGENLEKEKNKLEEENFSRRHNLGQGIKFEKYYEEIKSTLISYEEKLKGLKYSLENKKINKNKKYLQLLINKCNKVKLTLMIAVAINIVLFLAYMYGKSSIILFLVGFLALLNLIIVFYSNKLSDERREYEFELREEERRKSEYKEITKLEEKLSNYGQKVGINDYKKFLIALKRYEEYVEFYNTYKIRIEEREQSLREYNLSVLRETYISNKKVLEDLLEFTECSTAEEFLFKYKEYKRFKEANFKYVDGRESLIKEIEKLDLELNEIEKRVHERCEGTALKNVNMNELDAKLSKIKEKLNYKEDIERDLSTINEGYKVLLKDRDLKQLEDEISEMLEENISYDYSNEEEIEDKKNLYSKELIEVEKEIKDKENEISNRFIGKRTLFEIEEELEQTKELVNVNEKKLKALELTKEVMEKAFKEIQKNYGPILNEKVSKYIKSFSLDKYYDAKVSENFELVLKTKDGELMPANYLSNGALDSVYIALRLALIELIFDKEENITIFLDDAFVQYDDVRVKKIIEELYDLSKNKQIVLFTCHEREGKVAEMLGDVNIIRL